MPVSSSSALLAPALLLALPAAAATPSEGPSAEELFARGVRLQQAGDILGAIRAYERALRLDPVRVDARSNLGAAYVRLGRYEDAIGEYRTALETVPGEPTVRFNLALALYKAGRPWESAPELRAVLQRQPENRAALVLLADCLLQIGEDRGVVELLSPHEAEMGQDRLFAYLLGTALIREDELRRGQALIDRLFGGGDTAEARLLMGAAHLRRKHHQLALPELERAVELNPDLPTVQALYGRALMGSGDRPAAAAAFRRELEANPNNFDANLYLGLLLKDENRLDEALDFLARAERMRPRDPGVLYALGAVHLAAERLSEAERYLEAAVEEFPDFSQAHVVLARVYYRLGKRDLGERERVIVERLRAESTRQQPAVVEEVPQTDGDTASNAARPEGRR